MSISGAYVRVECDKCFDFDEIELTALAGRGNWDDRNVKRELERNGWTATEGRAHYCENCTTLRQEEASINQPPRGTNES